MIPQFEMLFSKLLKVAYWIKDAYVFTSKYIAMIDVNILQGFTLAILTILAPLFIGFLINMKSTNNDSDYKKLDYTVLLNYFINLPSLFISVIFAYASILMFRLLPAGIDLILFIIWSICNFFILQRIFLFYEWLRGFKDKYRKIYLSKLQKPKFIYEAFQSLWEIDIKDRFFERDVLEIFFNKVDILINKKQFKTVYDMLRIFIDNIHKRDSNNLVTGKFLNNSLQLYVELKCIFNKVKSSTTNDKTEYDFLHSSLMQSRLVPVQLLSVLLNENNFSGVTMALKKLYNLMTSQPEQYKDLVKKSFFSDYENGIPKLIFENPGRSIYLPSEWQINEENLKRRNEFAILWLYKFLEWVYRKTGEMLNVDNSNHKELLSKSLEESKKIDINLEILFSGYDKRILFYIFLLFIWCLYYKEYNNETWLLYRLIIQTPYFISPSITFSYGKKLLEKEIQEIFLKKEKLTLHLASLMLKNKIVDIPINELESCVRQIENIKCEEEADIDHKKRLVQIYSALMKSL